MQLPAIKRFMTDDYPTQTSWIGNLLYPLNLMLNTLYQGFNNGLTINQNMLGQITTLSVTGSKPTTSFAYKWAGQGAPVSVLVGGYSLASGTATPITSTVGVQWTYSAGTIAATVTGLPNNSNSYNVTFQVHGG